MFADTALCGHRVSREARVVRHGSREEAALREVHVVVGELQQRALAIDALRDQREAVPVEQRAEIGRMDVGAGMVAA